MILPDFPATHITADVIKALNENDTLIITAPPGAGKSTILPLAILDSLKTNGKILMLEPRRLAARAIAERMADILGEPVGRSVGYRVRFDNCTSKDTRIEVLTEGILTRILQSDNALEGVDVVIFDEFHERSLFSDVALALCRDCQQILRPDLKIIIMSATIDVDPLIKKLRATREMQGTSKGVAHIQSEGRIFDVEKVYMDNFAIDDTFPDTQNIATQVSRAVANALDTHSGDILAFLPGEAEIRRCEELLGSYQAEDHNLHIYPLYGMLSSAKQHQAIAPSKPGERKVVLATSIAETSITIDGVRIVIDSGLCRQLKYSPNNGLSHLETVRISLDMANQRAGRAGRTQNGVCYRLWSRGSEHTMAEYRKPEILTADLTQLVLDIASWGEPDINALTWLDLPPRAAVTSAKELLSLLDAIDDKGNITPHGREIQKLPCHPRISEMMLAANNDSERSLASDIAALVEERDPMRNEESVDINIRIDALRRHRAHNGNAVVWNRIEKVAAQYRKLLNVKEADNSSVDSELTGFLLAAAFPERIASSNRNHGNYTLTNGHSARLKLSDYLSHEDWIVVANLDARDNDARIFSASPINPRDLASRVRDVENISWNKQQGILTMQHEKRLGFMVMSATRIQHPDEEKVATALLDAVASIGEQLLDFNNESFSQLCARISSLRLWHPDEEWPDVTVDVLKANAHYWLAPYLNGVRTAQDFARLDITEALTSSLDYARQQDLARLAPSHIKVPSGSNIKLKYQTNGSAPVLAVRLQECFGMTDTPTVCNGEQKVLMHLLSPGYKPIQITQDMKSFWSDAYFEVRKELRSRYPKHVWPENPYNEEPTRRAKGTSNNNARK